MVLHVDRLLATFVIGALGEFQQLGRNLVNLFDLLQIAPVIGGIGPKKSWVLCQVRPPPFGSLAFLALVLRDVIENSSR
jgi:hypothetical protein